MVQDDDKKDSFSEIRDLLKKHYKPEEEDSSDLFWRQLSKKIDALFHRELFSEEFKDENGNLLSDEERYLLGLKQYSKNELSSLKHKIITDHLLECGDCRKNYNKMLDELHGKE